MGTAYACLAPRVGLTPCGSWHGVQRPLILFWPAVVWFRKLEAFMWPPLIDSVLYGYLSMKPAVAWPNQGESKYPLTGAVAPKVDWYPHGVVPLFWFKWQ